MPTPICILLRALDLYDPSVGYVDVKEALSRIKACYTLVSVTTDQLFKSIDLHKSKQLLEQAGVDLRFYEFPSDYGHDAFWWIIRRLKIKLEVD